jgi:drug/metabolite transporter (DMT)-like permease
MAKPLAPTPSFLASHLLGCSILWASGFLFMKLAGAVNPFVTASVRGLLGALTLALFFVLQGRSLLPQGREWRDWLVLGTVNGWGPNVLVAFALTEITAASASMIQAASPLIVALAAHALFADERLTPERLAGVLVGFVGMGILIGPAAFPDSGVSAAGAFAMVAVAVSYAVGNIYARAVKEADPARLALGQQFFSAVPATGLALALAGPAAFATVPEHGLSLLCLGVLATAVPILLFMRLIRGAGPTRAAMVGYLLPVWATLLAILFLAEEVGARELSGGAIVLVGVAIVSFTGRVARAR